MVATADLSCHHFMAVGVCFSWRRSRSAAGSRAAHVPPCVARAGEARPWLTSAWALPVTRGQGTRRARTVQIAGKVRSRRLVIARPRPNRLVKKSSKWRDLPVAHGEHGAQRD